jgi:hypothetical protein
LARRQASEQYFTSAQFLAQLRRQLMSKPHTTQGLLGKAALLPRKVGVGRGAITGSVGQNCMVDAVN